MLSLRQEKDFLEVIAMDDAIQMTAVAATGINLDSGFHSARSIHETLAHASGSERITAGIALMHEDDSGQLQTT